MREAEMQDLVLNAAREQGFEQTQALMLASCARNMYAIGCGYHPNTMSEPESTKLIESHGFLKDKRLTDGLRKAGETP